MQRRHEVIWNSIKMENVLKSKKKKKEKKTDKHTWLNWKFYVEIDRSFSS